ncbi:MAG TPA: HWE histidine kinase domain-containing protein [Pseudolabrys sp.]
MHRWWELFVSPKIRFSRSGSVALALACVVLATTARLLVGLLIGANLQFVFYFPAVLVATLFGGGLAGLTAIGLSILLAWLVFTPPYFVVSLPSAVEYANFAVFAASSLVIVWLAEAHRRQLERAQETIRQRDKSEVELHRTTALFQAVLKMTPDLVYVKDLQSRALLRNPAALFGKNWEDVEGRQEAEWHESPEEAAQVVTNDRMVIEAGTSMQFEEQFTTPEGVRTLLSTKSPLFDAQGKIVGIIGVSTDITERENRAKHVEFIMRELSHRSKNLLAIIQAVARQSIRQSSDLEDFEAKFNERLASLARLHDLLVQKEWHGASLHDIAQAQVGPFASDRVQLDGPEILLKPSMAQIISMAFHELATNASKYGALSNSSGTIAIHWSFSGDRKTIIVRWNEAGGPSVAPPQRKGFGIVVLERIALQIPDASVSLKFLPAGVTWTLNAPAEWLVEQESPSLDWSPSPAVEPT